MGMGSLIKFTSILKEHQADFNTITLCTFSHNKEISKILGYKKVILLPNTWWRLITKTIRLPFQKEFRPSLILDAERASNATSIFRKYLALFSNANSIYFNYKTDTKKKRDQRISLLKKTHSELFQSLLPFFRKRKEPSTPLFEDNKIASATNKILINVNASEYLFERRFPLEKYQKVISELHQNYPSHRIFLTGSSNENPYVNQLYMKLNAVGISVENTCGKWNLTKLSEELQEAALFITNDSGPMHLAVMLKTPTIAIWGPTHYTHSGYPDHDLLKNISLNMPCSPCFLNPTSKVGLDCKQEISCMKQLEPNNIIEEAVQLLSIQELTKKRTYG